MSVTVILTLKGRPLHTLRWMFHANRIGLPFPILVADGGNDEVVRRMLGNSGNYPRLNYRYLSYDDATVQDYWCKLADVVAQAETPYVMMSDNDDFILPGAVSAAAAYLDAETDCVSAGGWIATFSLHGANGLAGDLYNLTPKQGADFDAETAFQRVQDYLKRRFYLYYNVTRRDVLGSLFAETRDLAFRNFDVWELFLYLSLVATGKIRILKDLSYVRQVGSSQTHASNQGWIRNILYNDWVQDFHSFVDGVDRHAVAAGGIAPGEVGQFLRDHFAKAYSESVDLGRRPQQRRLQKLRDVLVEISACRQAMYALRRRHVLNALATAGADGATIKRLTAELSAVRETLCDPELRAQLAQTGLLPCG